MQKGVLIAGDDFKSGQTKLKSVLVDFLVGAGLKPTSIVSYNHLGNNDGMNLSAPQTFRSKVSKAWAPATVAAFLSGRCTEGTSLERPCRLLAPKFLCLPGLL